MDLKQTFLQAKILHGAMFFGVLLFAGLSFVLNNFVNAGIGLVVLPSNALYLIVLAAVAMLWLSGFIYKKRISVIEGNLPLQERVANFRSASILRVALIEAASLTLITGYLLSGNIYYLLVAFMPLYFFMKTFPRDEEISETLELSYSEMRQLH